MLILAHTKKIYLGNDLTLTIPRGTVMEKFRSLSRLSGRGCYKVAFVPPSMDGTAGDYLRSRIFDSCDVMRVAKADYNRVVHNHL